MVITEYKKEMYDCLKLYNPTLTWDEVEPVLNYSVKKRFKDSNCRVVNSYTNKIMNTTLLKIAEYIKSREPIVTAHGTMFKKHGEVPNPLGEVIQLFLDKRAEDKAMMFKFPKGSEDFEKYNLLQTLDKIDANGLEMNNRIAALA